MDNVNPRYPKVGPGSALATTVVREHLPHLRCIAGAELAAQNYVFLHPIQKVIDTFQPPTVTTQYFTF